MNLDDLRSEWAERDAALARGPAPDAQRLLQTLRQQAERASRRMGWFDIYEWVAGSLALVLLSAFLWTHGRDPVLAAMALAMVLWCLIFLVLNVRRRRAQRALDWAQPVLDLQRRFEALRLERLRLFKWALLIGQLVWYVPFLVVGVKALTGVNLVETAPHFVVSQLLIGLLFIPLAIGLARLLPARWWKHPRLRALADQLAGRDIVAGRRYLEQLQAVEEPN
ncbi:hypothetical protein [Inhella sp.]|uniref:hypothetical protein n=1 Tax=Inhella sp. TaxID=1921806 RepID=UPI0035B04335